MSKKCFLLNPLWSHACNISLYFCALIQVLWYLLVVRLGNTPSFLVSVCQPEKQRVVFSDTLVEEFNHRINRLMRAVWLCLWLFCGLCTNYQTGIDENNENVFSLCHYVIDFLSTDNTTLKAEPACGNYSGCTKKTDRNVRWTILIGVTMCKVLH